VRNKYFTVELTTPEYEPSSRAGVAEGDALAGEAAVLDSWSRSIFSNPIRELLGRQAKDVCSNRPTLLRARPQSFIFNRFIPQISLLARNVVPEYYLLLTA
jgi:hypothetical protein